MAFWNALLVSAQRPERRCQEEVQEIDVGQQWLGIVNKRGQHVQHFVVSAQPYDVVGGGSRQCTRQLRRRKKRGAVRKECSAVTKACTPV